MPQHQSILLQGLKNFLQGKESGARSKVWDNNNIIGSYRHNLSLSIANLLAVESTWKAKERNG